jgi:hypothetical protein
MLTAFKAQPIIELKQRDKSKIESVLAYGKGSLDINGTSSSHYQATES